MTNQPQEQEDWRSKFDEIWETYNFSMTGVDREIMADLISTEIERAKAEAYQDAIALSDLIESEGVGEYVASFGEWKAFKHFRNTLRDKLKQL